MPGTMDESQTASLQLFSALSKAYKTVVERAAKVFKDYGLSSSEFAILEMLYAKGSIPLQQIGDRILVTSGSITYNIDKLEKKNYLKRIPCTKDRRVIYAEITGEGARLIEDILPRHSAEMNAILGGLTQEEKLQMLDWLQKVSSEAKEIT